jgi:hypothetical protein
MDIPPHIKELRDLIAKELHVKQMRWAGSVLELLANSSDKTLWNKQIVKDWTRRMTMKWENLDKADRFLLRIEALDIIAILKDIHLVS